MSRESSMESQTPLSLLTGKRSLNRLVAKLQRVTNELLQNSEDGLSVNLETPYILEFSNEELAEVRADFADFIRQGEAKLHGLSHLLSRSLFDGPFELTSTVIGELEKSAGRFTLSVPVTVKQLLASSDLELGKRQLARLGFQSPEGSATWARPHLVANFVEYEPSSNNAFKATKLLSRIKAEQEIWNKVTDEIFDLDRLFARDKQLRHLSRYVKDVFGLKILTEDADSARALHSHLTTWRWTDTDIDRLNRPEFPEDKRSLRCLKYLEIKDYLAHSSGKDSGWKAIKSVVRWYDQTFELQIQPLPNFYREQEKFTRESHRSFKLSREGFREDVAQRVPLYGFIQDLLKWLFSTGRNPDQPSFPGVTIRLLESPGISASPPRGTELSSVKTV